MAEWKQTLEPYIKVTERIKTTTLNPTAGEDLIIGVVIISDAGSSKPTLIAGQDEFLSNYASRNISQDYINSLNDLYTGEDKTTAATMWSNAYRLAGSNTLLVVRASKSDNTFFSKPLAKSDQNTYLLRDGELLKKMTYLDSSTTGGPGCFKIVKDTTGDLGYESSNGWAICISGVGIIGNLTTDAGPQYDYLANSIPELVEKLNDTTKFFSPSYRFYKNPEATGNPASPEEDGIVAVVFDEVYLGTGLLDKTDPRLNSVDGTTNEGKVNLVTCLPAWKQATETQDLIDLNSASFSGFTPSEYYATNVYNSASDLRVRIRRFNHDAVVSKTIPDTTSLTEDGESPYIVLTQVLDTFTGKGTKEPAASILARDFYEVAILDPGVNDVVSYFNIGNILGRGDMEVSELNSLLTMMQLRLPDNMRDLNLNYFGYTTDDDEKLWMELENYTPEVGRNYPHAATKEALKTLVGVEVGTIYRVGGDTPATGDKYYKLTTNTSASQIFANLTVDPSKTKIISVDDSDLKKALDQIVLNEVYTVEGLSDLGNTNLGFQSYMANTAIGDNYFYPVSTVNSTNYMAIGNSISKLSQDSCKLYSSAPWDIDTGTLGWKYYAAPSVMYWESVSRNRRNNNEFAGILGPGTGVSLYQRPVCEFNKKQRQLLLSKRVNTVIWNTSTQAWNMNDNYTKQIEDNILSDDGNSRLCIRISKAIPTLLRQFIGKKINEKLCTDVRGVIDYFFKTVILPMNYTCEAYQITCNYDEVLARQNKIKVIVEVRYFRSLKFIEVYNNAFDVGMDFTGQE